MAQRAVGIGPGEQHQHVGAGSERAPRLDAVDHVPGCPVGTLGRRRRDLETGDVAAVVGLGDGDRDHHLGRGQLRQPVQLLLLGAALDEGPREDLRAGDQRPADPQAGPAELLGGDDHGQVLTVTALAVAAVLGGDGEPEGADLGEALDDVLGDVAVRAVDVLGLGRDDVLGEGAERVLDQLHVGVEVPRPARLGEGGDELGVAEAGQERARRAERARLDAPQLLPPGHAGDQVVRHVGDEGARDAGLRVALGAVVEERPRRRRGRGGVGDVVGEDLLGVGSAAGVEVAHGGRDDVVGQVDDLGGGRQVGRWGRGRNGHGPTLPTGTSWSGIARRVLPCRDVGADRGLLRIQRRWIAGVPRLCPAPRIGDRPPRPSGWCTAGATSG